MSIAPLGRTATPREEREANAQAVLALAPPLAPPPPGHLRHVTGEVLHASRSRPVVRWVVSDHGPDGVRQMPVIGKVYGKGGGQQAHELLVRLKEAGFGGAFDVPASLGFDPERKLLMQTEAPPRILKDGMDDLRASTPDVRRTGAWLARFHAVTGTTLPPLPAGFEEDKAEEYVSRLADAVPHLAWALRDIQARVLPRLAAAGAGPLVPTHGDFQPKNVHLDESSIVVIDFDRAALAPAARDLGHFVGQALTMAAYGGHAIDGPAQAWADAFLDAYAEAGGSQAALAGVPAYVARTFLEVLFYKLVVRPVRDASFAPAWVVACASWLERK